MRVVAKAEWSGEEELPLLRGFVVSSYSPLVAEVASRCLSQCYERPVPPEVGERMAVVLISQGGDVHSAVETASLVDSGQKVSPLLFFQSVPNAIAGHVAKRWGLNGPVVCVSPAGDPEHEAMELAGLLFGDGDADRALVVLVEQATVEGAPDRASALLIEPYGTAGGGKE
ncbi:beta-ketoacyl synthase chain length factor [Longispora albida]|uniref:beta-ketoacyl synthase chain length factor n=1 Tax=Longispora albida TaxID=203523 RepID=UPI00058E0E34|nr:beta-ketoacyl synthase chain length factor [Longispora albida]